MSGFDAQLEQVPEISRRLFLRGTLAVIGGAVGAEFLGACGSGDETQSPHPGAGQSETATANPAITPESKTGPVPTWEQDFSKMPDGPVDPKVWNIVTGNLIPSYNKEAETYTDRRQNVRIQDGSLVLEGHKESYDDMRYTSGRIDTHGKFAFKTGRLEATIELPQGTGTWPAFWLLPDQPKYLPGDYGVDPNSDNAYAVNGELDIMEAVGFEPNQVHNNHWSYNAVNQNQDLTNTTDLPTAETAYHTYGIEKTPGKLVFTYDGKVVQTIEKSANASPLEWPFEQAFYPIFNLALGGTWGGQESNQYPPDGIQGNGPWQMKVRNLRYFAAESK